MSQWISNHQDFFGTHNYVTETQETECNKNEQNCKYACVDDAMETEDYEKRISKDTEINDVVDLKYCKNDRSFQHEDNENKHFEVDGATNIISNSTSDRFRYSPFYNSEEDPDYVPTEVRKKQISLC